VERLVGQKLVVCLVWSVVGGTGITAGSMGTGACVVLVVAVMVCTGVFVGGTEAFVG
jgi:hypothetical protein